MRTAQSKIRTVLLALIWLAVVGGAVALAVTRREEYGASALIAVGIASFMLIIFVISFLPKHIQDKSPSDLLGKLSVGALILLAIAVLGYALVKGPRGILATAALVLFLVSFVRIFIDYIRDFGKSSGKARSRAKSDSHTEEKREEQEV